MNDNEDSFAALRRLLKLKRHEAPPPGYFNDFSAQILAGIRAEESKIRQTRAAHSSVGNPWFAKFLQLFEFKQAFAGALASALCLLLIFGIVYADRPDSGLQPFFQNSSPSLTSFAAMTPSAMPTTDYTSGLISSNNPSASLQPVASFLNSETPFMQPVSFSPSGN